MSENNEKTKKVTYIKNGKYTLDIIKIIPHSPTYIEKIGITIYKKSLEINILNKDCIDLLLNTNSNYIESYADIGFLNLHGIICFFYAANSDIKEKEKIIAGNNKSPYKIYKIKNIHCVTVSFYIPPKIKKIIKEEFQKIGKFLITEGLFLSQLPYRFDLDIPSQFKVFQDNSFKYKIYEKFQYNENFSPNICKSLLTPIVKGFYKRITYNNLFNEKEFINIAIRYKIYENNKYLIEIESFITPNTSQKYFQSIFYVYFNESSDKISFLNKILENWSININKMKNFNNIKNNGNETEALIINIYNNLKNDENEEIKNNNFKEEINKHKNIDFINIKNTKVEEIENILNSNIEKIKSVGYNYQYNNIDYSSQNKLLIMTINDLNLFSLSKIIVYILYGIVLSERGYQKNVINNVKEEIIKKYKVFDKKIQKFKSKYPERLKLNIITNENDLKNIIKYEEKRSSSINFNINNKEFVMFDSTNKEDKDFVIVDSVENFENKNNDENNNNNNEKKNFDNEELFDESNNIENNNINVNVNENTDEEKDIKEKNISNEDKSEIIKINENDNINEDNKENENIYEINNEEEKMNENIDNDYKENYNNDNQINDNYIKEQILINNEKMNSPKIINKNNILTIFIGTFNVNALESDLIKKTNLDPFLFPEKIKKYFTEENYPTFYCIGLEETVELNPKNVLIKPKNKAELWEERISEELQQKYNYFLQCKEQLVGVLLLFFVKAKEIKFINKIHFEKLKFGFMGCGNKGCCFLDFEYKNLSYGFCSCHLPAGQNKKNFLDRKETFKHILDFQVNKNIYEFYKNDFFFIFGDLNFRTKKIGLIDLQNHIKIILSENKFNKDFKKKSHFRGSLDIPKKKNKEKDKDKDKNKRDKSTDKICLDKKEKEDYSNYYSNKTKGNDKKQCNNMDENIFIQYFFNDFLLDEELKKLREKELFIYDVDEADITFPPTYKYTKGTNFYNLSKRVPSWTDRILYKKNKKITPIYYDRICINFSDHKPIVGLFQINTD